jgi:phosphoribosylaminoimidazole-succinocarboxamide synthase
VRDYLEEQVQAGEWNRQPPAPDLPEAVVSATTARYREAYERITSHPLPEF